MDLIGKFNAAFLARINGDAWMSAGVPAQLILQDDETRTEEEVLKEINDRLNLTGVVGTFHGLIMDRTEGDRFVFKGGVFWEVNKKKNQSSTGTQKPGRHIFQQTMGLIQRARLAISDDSVSPVRIDPFSQLLVTHGERIGEEGGVELWMIEFETNCAISVS